MQNFFFLKTQRLIKGAIATAMGALNLGGISLSIWIAQTDPFQSMLFGLSQWLLLPQPINMWGILKSLINLLIWLLGKLISLIFWLLSLGHTTPITRWIDSLASALIAALNHLTANWLTIATITPSNWIPFAKQILDLIASSDAIAAIFMATLITVICTSLTIWLLSLDLPRYFARKINQRRANRAYRQLEKLEATLAQIDLTELPANDAEALRQLSLLLRYRKQSSQIYSFPLSIPPINTPYGTL